MRVVTVFKQPRAEGVELTHLRHVDLQGCRLLKLRQGYVGETLQLICVNSRPGSTGTELQCFAPACCSQARCKARDIRRPGTNLRHEVELPILPIEDEAGGCSVRKKTTLAVGQTPFSGTDALTTGNDDPLSSYRARLWHQRSQK